MQTSDVKTQEMYSLLQKGLLDYEHIKEDPETTYMLLVLLNTRPAFDEIKIRYVDYDSKEAEKTEDGVIKVENNESVLASVNKEDCVKVFDAMFNKAYEAHTWNTTQTAEEVLQYLDDPKTRETMLAMLIHAYDHQLLERITQFCKKRELNRIVKLIENLGLTDKMSPQLLAKYEELKQKADL